MARGPATKREPGLAQTGQHQEVNSAVVEGVRTMAEQAPASSAPPVQRRVYEAVVNRPTEAVQVDPQGSIVNGTVYRNLGLGEYVRLDDADKWRSRRESTSLVPYTRWYGARRLGTTTVAGMHVYVRDQHVQEATESQGQQVDEALLLEHRFGAEVEAEVDRICHALGIDRSPNPSRSSVEHVIKYFAWLAQIGTRLGEIYPKLHASVATTIEDLAANATEEQLNENSVEGMALDRSLVEAVNQRLKVWVMVLTSDTNEVVESLIDATGRGTLPDAITSVTSDNLDLVQTVGNYLRLGKEAIDKALAHNEEKWTLALKSTLDSISGCYAAQAQAVERVQPIQQDEHVFDPSYDRWEIKGSELGSMGIQKGDEDIENLENLKVGDVVKSLYVNPDYTYTVESISGERIVLKANR